MFAKYIGCLAIVIVLPLETSLAQRQSDVDERIAAERAGRAARDAVPDAQQLADLLKSLEDPDESVRGDAVTKIRLLARRVDKFGPQRIQRGDITDPKVDGLVPILIHAAQDKARDVRRRALYALADTLHPDAVLTLRKALQDEDEKVRVTAACLLTEFQDASGLEELKKSVKRLNPANNEMDYFEAEPVFASLQRITGKSFGEIPMNPGLFSNSHAGAAAKVRYNELIATWAAWWDWMPPQK
ncbi:MAG: HEAT repeat domain-containing protein [Pirellulales bacterium]